MAKGDRVDGEYAALCPQAVGTAQKATIADSGSNRMGPFAPGSVELVGTAVCFLRQGDSSIIAVADTPSYYHPSGAVRLITVTSAVDAYVAVYGPSGASGVLYGLPQ